MLDYQTILHPKTWERLERYHQQVGTGAVQTGFYLYKELKQVEQLGFLSTTAFLELLVNTKKPQIFAESAIKGDGSDWNLEELAILGDLSVVMPVEIYDDGNHTQPMVHARPFEGTLCFTPGALLRNDRGNTPVDWVEVVKDGQLDEEAYYQLYERRLLPVLLYIQQVSVEQKALVTIPGMGCGMFAGKFQGRLGEAFKRVLQRLLETHHTRLSNIKAVYYDPYQECQNERLEFGDLSLLVRPLTQQLFPTCQLLEPKMLGDHVGEFADCRLFSFVAWDHVSWPGNDFHIGSRATDDGVKAAATSALKALTDRPGYYDPKQYKYLPPTNYKTWKQLIIRAGIRLKVVDRLQVLGE